MFNLKASCVEITHSHEISIFQSGNNWTCALQIIVSAAILKLGSFHESIMSSSTDSDSSQELLEVAASVKKKCTDPGSSHKRVKAQYDQRYLDKYSKIPGITHSKKGSSFAHCNYCNIDFNISHSGSYDISRHCERKGHKDMERMAKSNACIRQFLPQPEMELEKSVIKAETMFTEMIVKLNLPLTAADTISRVVKVAFPDSKIAKKYECGRSKSTALVKQLAHFTRSELVERMKNSPFSIATDGSNDQREKQFPVVVTTFGPDGIIVGLLSVPVLSEAATGMLYKVRLFS